MKQLEKSRFPAFWKVDEMITVFELNKSTFQNTLCRESCLKQGLHKTETCFHWNIILIPTRKRELCKTTSKSWKLHNMEAREK
jgi:hypothetical protein